MDRVSRAFYSVSGFKSVKKSVCYSLKSFKRRV